jgi:hypothetical protein
VPVGVAGQLYVGGEGLARGYLNRPDLTAARFVPDPFAKVPGSRLYATGDVVKRRSDGALDFLGRRDGQVKLRGFRIELEEIEAALRDHESVREAVAVVREDRAGDARLVAYATAREGASLDARGLRDHLKRKLPEHMVPSAFVVREALPLTPNGKVDRRALPAPDDGSRDAVSLAPTTALEKRIAAVWEDVLGVPRVGIHENFFDLGGHSLLLLQVHSRLRAAFPDSDLEASALFEHPTVASLARRLEAGASRRGAPESALALDDGRERLDEARQRLGRRRELARALEAKQEPPGTVWP